MLGILPSGCLRTPFQTVSLRSSRKLAPGSGRWHHSYDGKGSPTLGTWVGKEITKMSLSPFGRRGGFYDAHSEVNRLLDEMFGGIGRRPGSRGAQTTVEWAPSVDVLQKEGDLVVRVEMPGVKPEDVHVAVHNRVLTISGERKVDEEEERAGYYVRELRHGSFQRSMILPEGVDEERIHARYQDGILEVALEGAAAAREPRSIQIEVPPGGQQSVTDVEVGESTQGTALQGDAPPEAPPETPPR